MRKSAVFLCFALIIGGVFLSGCVSNDDKFTDAFSDLETTIKPDMILLAKSFANYDLDAASDHCRQLVSIDSTYIARISEIQVRDKYKYSKQYLISGLENQRKGCQLLIESPHDNIGLASEYFHKSTNDFTTATQLLPN